MFRWLSLLFLSVLFDAPFGFGQKKIDQAFVFPSGGGFRKYSIYEPTNYKNTDTIKMLVGFHPFEIGVWNAESWRDTLIPLAESKGLLLVCPDGGLNGRIDESFDYEFIEALIDSMMLWYYVDESKVYAIGFGDGAKAVYEYGLDHHKTFRGFITIGSNINGTTFIDPIIHRAKCRNFYVIHGGSDNPNSRFYPIRDALILNGAKVNSILMASIGHTYNFPNRETILKTAMNFIDTVYCDFTSINETLNQKQVSLFPSIVSQGEVIHILLDADEALQPGAIQCYNSSGQRVLVEFSSEGNAIKLYTSNCSTGVHFLRIQSDLKVVDFKFIVR